MKRCNVLVGKGARGRYTKRLTISGPAAEGFARMTVSMVPNGYRGKVEVI